MINELLKRKNISPYRLSKLSGVPYSTLSDIISGRTALSSVTAGTLAGIARALGVSMDELYNGKPVSKPVYLYNEGRNIHIVYEDLHFQFLGPKNLISFKNINRIVDGCAHVNSYYSDKKIIYIEEEYIDLKGEFIEYGCEDRFPSNIDLRLRRPEAPDSDRYKDEALMICDNMVILNHESSTDHIEIEIINMARQSSRMIMRLNDYAILATSMSNTMQNRVMSIVRRNQELISALSAERGGTYA